MHAVLGLWLFSGEGYDSVLGRTVPLLGGAASLAGPVPTGPVPTGPVPTGPVPTGPGPTGAALSKSRVRLDAATPCHHCGHRRSDQGDPLAALTSGIATHPRNHTDRSDLASRHLRRSKE